MQAILAVRADLRNLEDAYIWQKFMYARLETWNAGEQMPAKPSWKKYVWQGQYINVVPLLLFITLICLIS